MSAFFVPSNFLHSLCVWVAASTSLAYGQTPSTIGPWAIWRSKGLKDIIGGQKVYTDPFSAFRIYAGGNGSEYFPTPELAIQCQTMASVAAGEEAALNRAQILFAAACLDTTLGLPIRMVTIPAYLADQATADGHYLLRNVDFAGRPGLTGRDEQDRPIATFNFRVGIDKQS
jgi:hypothetical protein